MKISKVTDYAALIKHMDQFIIVILTLCIQMCAGVVCFVLVWKFYNGPRQEKTCPQEYPNNKGTDQPAHPRSLISIFVVPVLESIISQLNTSDISLL